jgi:hypothetical protein
MFQEQTRNLWDNVKRFQWSHEDYLKYRLEMMKKAEWQSLPRWAVSLLRGYDAALYDQVWSLLEFGYVIDGEFVSIQSDKWHKNRYKYFDRQRDGTLDLSSDSGHHAWKAESGVVADKFWN